MFISWQFFPVALERRDACHFQGGEASHDSLDRRELGRLSGRLYILHRWLIKAQYGERG